jgi:hypothetical protein
VIKVAAVRRRSAYLNDAGTPSMIIPALLLRGIEMKTDLCTPPSGATIVTTRTTRQWLGEDRIMRVICLPDVVMRLEDAVENVRAYPQELLKTDKPPILIDLRQIRSLTREAREFFSSSRNERIRAAALLIDSPLSRIIGNFFIGLSKMRVDHQLFTSDVDAIAWLKRYVT